VVDSLGVNRVNYWIFQSAIDDYDLRKPDTLKPGTKRPWKATRYRSYMSPEDIVFFWLAGPADVRGIYGWGILESEPYAPGKSGDFQVDVAYRRKFTNHIPAHQIAQRIDERKLDELLIFRVRVGTNFLISAEQARTIAELAPSNESPEVNV
jgi:hypothetical protein